MYIITSDHHIIDRVRLNRLATHRIRMSIQYPRNGSTISLWIVRVDPYSALQYKLKGVTVFHSLKSCSPPQWDIVALRRYSVGRQFHLLML